MRSIVLIGFMGAGKTTVGRALSEILALPYIDTDQEVENRVGRTVSEIFAEQGEPFFREAETAVLKALPQVSPIVISCGGGTILSAENRKLLQHMGAVIYLQADWETLWQRIREDTHRPLLGQKGGRERGQVLLQERQGLYEAVADFRVCTAKKSVRQICREILAWERGEK